jgi:hypothetical protein
MKKIGTLSLPQVQQQNVAQNYKRRRKDNNWFSKGLIASLILSTFVKVRDYKGMQTGDHT